MKKLLAAMFVALLMVGCGGPDFGKSLSDGVGGFLPGVPDFGKSLSDGVGGIIWAMIMAILMLVVIAVAVVLIGGIVGGVVASKRKKGVRKGFFVGLGYGSLLVVLVIGVYESYGRLYTALEERGARKQVEKEAKIWAKKIGLDDHRIILDAVDISSLWPHEGREVPSRDYTGWVKTMTDNYKGHIGRIEMLAQLKDGLFITIAVWKPNGEKCPATNVKKGNGVRVWYNDDGTEDGRWIYKDGKVVSRTSHHSNGQKKEEATYKDGQKDGLSTGWYENGQKSSEGNYKLTLFKRNGIFYGKRDGLWTEWYMDGQKKEELTYKDGKQDGLWMSWYPNGQEEFQANYKDGKRDGLLTEWYENGQKKEEATYKDGQKNGLATGWRENGQKHFQGTYKQGWQNGERNGIWIWWHENGQKMEEATYKDGKVISTMKWDKDGKIDLDDHKTRKKIVANAVKKSQLQRRGKEGEELLYRMNKPKPYTGWTKWIHDNGRLVGLSQFKNGKLDGLRTWWYPNGTGRKKAERTYKDGKLWTAVRWKPNGEKCPVTNVVNGSGVVVQLHPKGPVHLSTTFKDGKIVKD